ncbi:NmrA family protein [Lentithecium fluviatile CBS 122367]|uniref:NmrA family protein n=1 Tax=Lentithecium fluviatile CBS 122367 TaxID=1168545 RepID=A0A6G1IE84_9PLEO|nr:NmrA family protein [Lentithecium fluviatile CBS 122367]
MAPTKIFIIGGTGAQGIPIIRSLVQDNIYAVRILTRDPTSPRAQSLKSLGPNVELIQGSFTDEASLKSGYRGCDAAFVNIDGFNVGEKTEMYWAVRAYELAVADGGIKFFVYGNLEYVGKLAGYKEEFRSGHYDGKGRIGEWILFQGVEAKKARPDAMCVALFTTGPYIEMVLASGTIMTPTIEKNAHGEDVVTWKAPLTNDGAVAHVSLDDCGPYVRWLFDHPEEANGMDLQVAIDHIAYADLAAAFTKVTGHPAQFIDVSLDTWWKEGPMKSRAEFPAGYSADPEDPATMSFRRNFDGFWNIWRISRRNGSGLIQRNYKLLDEILPERIRSAEDFFRREDEKARMDGGSLWEKVKLGRLQPLLKLQEDRFRAPALE